LEDGFGALDLNDKHPARTVPIAPATATPGKEKLLAQFSTSNAGNPDAFALHYALDDEQKALLAEYFPGTAFRPVESKPHTHPLSSISRSLCEVLALEQMRREDAQLVIDVGGAAQRHCRRAGQLPVVWSACPVLSGLDEAKVTTWLHTGVTDWCVHLAQDCDCYTLFSADQFDAALSIHSAYYLEPEVVATIIANTRLKFMICVHHNFPDAVGYFFPRPDQQFEATYRNVDGHVTMKLFGNSHVYKHPDPLWLSEGAVTTRGWLTTQVLGVYGPTTITRVCLTTDAPPPSEALLDLGAALLDVTHSGAVTLKGVSSISDKTFMPHLGVVSAGPNVNVYHKGITTVVPKTLVNEVGASIVGMARTAATYRTAVENTKRLVRKLNLPPRLAYQATLVVPAVAFAATASLERDALETYVHPYADDMAEYNAIRDLEPGSLPRAPYWAAASATLLALGAGVAHLLSRRHAPPGALGHAPLNLNIVAALGAGKDRILNGTLAPPCPWPRPGSLLGWTPGKPLTADELFGTVFVAPALEELVKRVPLATTALVAMEATSCMAVLGPRVGALAYAPTAVMHYATSFLPYPAAVAAHGLYNAAALAVSDGYVAAAGPSGSSGPLMLPGATANAIGLGAAAVVCAGYFALRWAVPRPMRPLRKLRTWIREKYAAFEEWWARDSTPYSGIRELVENYDAARVSTALAGISDVPRFDLPDTALGLDELPPINKGDHVMPVDLERRPQGERRVLSVVGPFTPARLMVATRKTADAEERAVRTRVVQEIPPLSRDAGERLDAAAQAIERFVTRRRTHFDPIDPTSRPAFEAWVSRFPESVRQMYVQGFNSLAATPLTDYDYKIGAFLKLEKLAKSEVGAFEDYNPRVISSRKPRFMAFTGPTMARVYVRLRELLTADTPFFYSSGASAEGIGAWFTNALKDGYTLLVKADSVKHDRHVRAEHHSAWHKLVRRLGASKAVVDALVRNAKQKTGKFPQGTQYVAKNQVASGDNDTNTEDTYVMMLCVLTAMHELTSENLLRLIDQDLPLPFRCVLCGDDTVIAINPDPKLWGGVFAYDLFAQQMARVGLELDGYCTDKPWEIEFCSALFWPVAPTDVPGHGHIEFVLAPKPGRVLPKVGVALDFKGDPAVWLRGNALGLRADVSPVPFLREVVLHILRLSSHILAKPIVEHHKAHAGYHWEYCDATWTFLHNRYGLTPEDLSDFVYELDKCTTFTVMLNGPAVQVLIDTDN